MAQNQNQDVSTDQLSPNNSVVRIDHDSDSDLQALFDTVLKPDANRQLQVPLRLRKFPSSFFIPPCNGSKSSSVSHSRDNSADSAFDSGSASGAHQIIHSRAHSSPASLQQTYAMGQQQNLPPHHHSKQRSYDSITPNDQMPLPPGWEQARTAEGQIYYLNHITCSTTWEDPRKTGQINQHQLQLNPLDMTTQSIIPNLENKPSTLTELRPLPYGWEQSTTAEGEIYFINHQTRTTSWFDPRIPVHLQRSPTNSVLPMMTAISSQEQVTQQKMRLQMLQLERDRLKQRQEEIRRQQGMMMQTNVTMDSYLSGLAEHSRQESADSGLGMGTANIYTTSDNPEDFLANISNVINHMDCASEEVLEEFPNVTLDDVQSLIDPSTPSEMISKENDLTWL